MVGKIKLILLLVLRQTVVCLSACHLLRLANIDAALPHCDDTKSHLYGSNGTCYSLLHCDPGYYLSDTKDNCCPVPEAWKGYKVTRVFRKVPKDPKRAVDCPDGYFVDQAMLQTVIRDGFLLPAPIKTSIGCSKPTPYRRGYQKCIEAKTCDSANWYFVAGQLKADTGKVLCCRMSPEQEGPQSVEEVKLNIMDDTLVDLAKLAKELGHVNNRGCVAQREGDSFRARDTIRSKRRSFPRHHRTKWIAMRKPEYEVIPYTKTCNWEDPDAIEKNIKPLRILYTHWNVSLKSMAYGQVRVKPIKKTLYKNGTVRNEKKTVAEIPLHVYGDYHQVVYHEPLNREWISRRELVIELRDDLDIGPQESEFNAEPYRFWYEQSETETDANGVKHKKEASNKQSVKMGPCESKKWKAFVHRSELMLNYTATFIATFNIKFAPGGRVNDEKIGSSDAPFVEELKEVPKENRQKEDNEELKHLVKSLTNKDRYEFSLKGSFKAVTTALSDVEVDHAAATKICRPGVNSRITSRGSKGNAATKIEISPVGLLVCLLAATFSVAM